MELCSFIIASCICTSPSLSTFWFKKWSSSTAGMMNGGEVRRQLLRYGDRRFSNSSRPNIQAPCGATVSALLPNLIINTASRPQSAKRTSSNTAAMSSFTRLAVIMLPNNELDNYAPFACCLRPLRHGNGFLPIIVPSPSRDRKNRKQPGTQQLRGITVYLCLCCRCC